ncbi:Fic family protein [bacterium]|nr:Fic family protein [bacterium]
MPYIWEREDWPRFKWDSSLLDRKVYEYAKQSNRLLGEIKYLSDDIKTESLIDLMVSEAVKTSQIEGEKFERDDVRSSIRNQLGLNQTPELVKDPSAHGIASLMVSVRNHFKEPLTTDNLFEWQSTIINVRPRLNTLEVGRWRSAPSPMQIVSGAIGKEIIHYEAPPSDQIAKEMDRYIIWFNNSNHLNAAIRAGVAHLYFECIHPFADGNGRIGRAISEIALSQELGHPVLLSLSSTIQGKRNEYYDALNKASHGDLDITEWLIWFTELVLESQLQSKDQIKFVLTKARFWDKFNPLLNERQNKVLNRMIRDGLNGFIGGISAQKYSKISGCSKATATRDLTALFNMGAILMLEGRGRSTGYDLNLEAIL